MIIGDKARFAIDVSWKEECPPLGDDGQRATWALLQIFCNGQSLTRHVIRDKVQQDILGPASTIATWMLSNWPALMHEERVIGAPRASHGHELLEKLNDTEWDTHEQELDTWWRSHNLRGANQGLQLPDILFWRKGSYITISWRNDPEPRTDLGIQFLPGNHWASFPASELDRVFRDFIHEVSKKIQSADEHSASRETILAGHEKIKAPWHQQLDTLASKLGRSENSLRTWLAPEQRSPEEMIKRFKSEYGVEPKAYLEDKADTEVAMAARSSSPAFTETDHVRLVKLKNKLSQHPPAKGLSSLRKKLGDELHLADIELRQGGGEHQYGYRLARAVRQRLRNKTQYLDIETYLDKIGIQILEEDFDDKTTDGVTLWGQDDHALIAINQNSPRAAVSWGRRAVLAHELYHLLIDSMDRHAFGECTNQFTPSPSERKANAFAAELLLPSSTFPKYLHTHAEKQVKRLCEAFQVGWELCIRQLENHRRITKDLAHVLLDNVELRFKK